MPFVFTLGNTPRVGDKLYVDLQDGDSNQREYFVEYLSGSIVDFLNALADEINADVLFVAVYQLIGSSPGLSITQVTPNFPGGFTGEAFIDYGDLSSSPAQTLSFDEETNSFESFLSYHPEMFGTLGTTLISYSGGQLYTHDNTRYNYFYGVQYESSISVIFNDQSPVKKTFNAVGYQSNKNWASPTDGDIVTSMINPQTELPQISNLKSVDYEIYENVWAAAYLRDANSGTDPVLAVLEGDYLKGVWIKHKFVCPVASTRVVVEFVKPYVNFSISNRNF